MRKKTKGASDLFDRGFLCVSFVFFVPFVVNRMDLN
jgi:hypothetical protein